MTLNDLAEVMQDGFASAEKSTDKKIENLALMVAKGFNDVNERMDKRFKEMNEKMDNGFKEMDEKIDKGFHEAKSEREDIRADINKKVDKIEHNTLTYRVEKLEKKFA